MPAKITAKICREVSQTQCLSQVITSICLSLLKCDVGLQSCRRCRATHCIQKLSLSKGYHYSEPDESAQSFAFSVADPIGNAHVKWPLLIHWTARACHALEPLGLGTDVGIDSCPVSSRLHFMGIDRRKRIRAP